MLRDREKSIKTRVYNIIRRGVFGYPEQRIIDNLAKFAGLHPTHRYNRVPEWGKTCDKYFLSHYSEIMTHMKGEMIEMENPKLELEWPKGWWWGKEVWKKRGIAAGYEGPGYVRGHGLTIYNEIRIIVGHTIAGGEGELFHIYSENQLESK